MHVCVAHFTGHQSNRRSRSSQLAGGISPKKNSSPAVVRPKPAENAPSPAATNGLSPSPLLKTVHAFPEKSSTIQSWYRVQMARFVQFLSALTPQTPLRLLAFPVHLESCQLIHLFRTHPLSIGLFWILISEGGILTRLRQVPASLGVFRYVGENAVQAL